MGAAITTTPGAPHGNGRDHRIAVMPFVRANWTTCVNEKVDHLVPEVSLTVVDNAVGALCGRPIVPAPLVCAPRERCARCERHVESLPACTVRPTGAKVPRWLRRT